MPRRCRNPETSTSRSCSAAACSRCSWACSCSASASRSAARPATRSIRRAISVRASRMPSCRLPGKVHPTGSTRGSPLSGQSSAASPARPSIPGSGFSMSTARYVGAVDQGTTSTRFMVFDRGGNEIARHQLEHQQIMPQPGWVEHDPLEIAARTDEVMARAMRNANLTAADLAAIGITNQRETTIVWNPKTGRPWYNAIVWQDTRTDRIINALSPDQAALIRTRTGLPPATYFSGAKIQWILDNVSGVREAATRGEAVFGNPDTWIVWHLTGGRDGGTHATDVTNASRTMLMNLETCEWDEDLLRIFNVPRAMLPAIHASADRRAFGVTRREGPAGGEVPIAGDLTHVIYVWMDALINYCTAVGFGSDEKRDKDNFAKYWPANVHMIGKEIVRFHCVYWPAFLMAAGMELPKAIVAHGWLLFEESKMSKSRGNIVRTETILDVLGADALRYFLLREVVFGQDGSFSFDALVQRYNSDLANELGNLASRTLTMINRYFKGEVPYPSHAVARTADDDAIAEIARKTIRDFGAFFDQFQFSRALETTWGLVAAVDKYIVENEPWSLGEKQDDESRARLATVLYTSAEALRIATALAHPVMPEATAKIWEQLGLGDIKKLDLTSLTWGQLPLGTKLGKVSPVFPRADKSAIERMQQMEEQQRGPAEEASATATQAVTPETTPPAAAPTQPASASDGAGKITIDDFAKIELRVGLVKVAERVPKSDKLLRLEVDIGTEVRQVLAGIAEAYAPETLVGRKVVIVANLAPRKLRGYESNGMIVAASLEGGKPVLASFLEEVDVGARLK